MSAPENSGKVTSRNKSAAQASRACQALVVGKRPPHQLRRRGNLHGGPHFTYPATQLSYFDDDVA